VPRHHFYRSRVSCFRQGEWGEEKGGALQRKPRPWSRISIALTQLKSVCVSGSREGMDEMIAHVKIHWYLSGHNKNIRTM